MDSANSSSLHSGDDEFDSRTHSLSAAFFPSSAASQPPLNHHHYSFDSLSYLHSSSLLPNFPSQLTTATSRGVHIGAVGTPSPVQPPGLSSTAAAAAALPRRGSKKRPRASRRAPTTVLAADTSNFRAMVQEFTGNPSPSFTRARLNFSGSAAPEASSVAASLLPHHFMPKLQAPCFPPISSTSSVNASASSNTSNNPYALGQSFLQPLLHAKSTLPKMPAAFDTRPPPQASQPAGYNLNELGLLPELIASEGMRSNYDAVSQNSKE